MKEAASGREEPRDGTTAASPLPADVVRALAWLRAHACEPVALDTLAAVAGVRPRTLQAHFQRFLRATPRAVARRIRLSHARTRLLAGAESRVTEIALSTGFTQPGRFAAAYRRQFGELPSTTRTRRREAGERFDPAVDEAKRLCHRALPSVFAVASDECSAALEAASRAQALAPDYALPKAMAAWCLRQRHVQRFPDTRPEDDRCAAGLARDAITLAPDDSLVLTLCAGALTLGRALDEADALVTRALAIDPWAAWAWVRRGWLGAYHGDPAMALSDLGVALELMPFEPLRHLTCIGIACAHFDAGRYEHAARWAQDGVDACPGSLWASRIVAAAAAHAGAFEEARRTVRTIERHDPALTVDAARAAWPFRPSFLDRLADGLAAAGLRRN
jgi:AraC-like DNA-binding protein